MSKLTDEVEKKSTALIILGYEIESMQKQKQNKRVVE